MTDVTEPAISEHLAAELDGHRGQWVAIYNGKVVAVADTAEAVVASAQKQHITDPLVFRVPAHPEQLNFL